ncbi:hypothetical protein QJS04_geneDACA006091 [Acorus gramineus]|uniref:Glutaredoxin domain-containing protein n=1 Tax=Acorus gramineus TaxID=55184 RepID=A0AAV9B3K2_ACOGR|nr:hypothetical protein QJS04_geneDACA006091 [Acorus gramineus]
MATVNLSILSLSPTLRSTISSSSTPSPPLHLHHSLSSSSTLSRRSSALSPPPSKPRTRTTSSSSPIAASAVRKLSETEPLPIPPEAEALQGKFPPGSGVYAVYDCSDALQFIGVSRNIAASIASHRKTVSPPDLCSSVKIGLMDEATPDRAALTEAWKSWMEEHIGETGRIPPGNEPDNNTWIRRPQKKKPNLRLTPGRHVKLTVPLEELIDRLVKEKRVVAFIKGSRSAPQCGFSQRVVGLLETHNADFECVDVLDEEYNFGLRETLKRYSNWPTFPQVFVNGELVGGCDIVSSMAEKGELSKLLQT